MGMTSIDRFNGDQLQALSTHTRYEVIDRGNHKSRHICLFYGICLITYPLLRWCCWLLVAALMNFIYFAVNVVSTWLDIYRSLLIVRGD